MLNIVTGGPREVLMSVEMLLIAIMAPRMSVRDARGYDVVIVD